MPAHFIRVCDLDQEALYALFDQAQTLEDAFRGRSLPQALRGKRIALLFEDGGFRNRVAFDLGVRLMGGEAVFVLGRPGEKEPAHDMARYLSNWFDGIIVRTPNYTVMEDIAQAAGVPVINARTSHNHPCEILGDLAFVRKERGNIDGLKIVFVGEAANLCHSWFEAAACLPLEVVQVCPPGYEVDSGFQETMKRNAVGRLTVSHDLEAALRGADIVYTDCWPRRNDLQGREAVSRAFSPYRITAELLGRTPDMCMFLPCPPVTRGEEVSADAMTSSKCRVYEAKAYLLHAQNALLSTLVT